MWQGSYGKEPFDLRLTMLRFVRCLNKILLLTLAGTLLFGGGYFVKNVLLRQEKEYSATSTFKVEYEVPPVQSGDYYINSMTWNTLVKSQEFLCAVQAHLQENSDGALKEIPVEELAGVVSATLPSDWNIPIITVVADRTESTLQIMAAVEAAMENEFAENMQEVKSVRVIDSAPNAEEVKPDVRPVQAFVLSALLSFFFAAVIFLLKETGDDSIWLPATLRQRYGLPVAGTINSAGLKENICYLLQGKEKIAVCPMDSRVNAAEVIKALEVIDRADSVGRDAAGENERLCKWLAVPSPILYPESCRELREADGILLVVPAGNHVGKPLEYLLDYLTQQDCEIAVVILWNADEKLLDAYYCFAKSDIR